METGASMKRRIFFLWMIALIGAGARAADSVAANAYLDGLNDLSGGNYADAENAFTQAIASDGENAACYQARGVARTLSENFAGAAAAGLTLDRRSLTPDECNCRIPQTGHFHCGEIYDVSIFDLIMSVNVLDNQAAQFNIHVDFGLQLKLPDNSPALGSSRHGGRIRYTLDSRSPAACRAGTQIPRGEASSGSVLLPRS
jgi:hypothetical protein